MARRGLLKIVGLGATVLAISAFIGGVMAVIQEDLSGGVEDVGKIRCSSVELKLSAVSLDGGWLNATLRNSGQQDLTSVSVKAVENGNVTASTFVTDFTASSFDAVSMRVVRRPDALVVTPANCEHLQKSFDIDQAPGY